MKINTSAFPAEHMETAIKMGLNSPLEALLCAPDRYEDYRTLINDFDQIDSNAEQQPVVVAMKVMADQSGNPKLRCYGKRGAPTPKGGYLKPDKLLMRVPFSWGSYRLEVEVQDTRGNTAVLSVFGAINQWRDVKAGDQLILRGNAERAYGRLRFNNCTPVDRSSLGMIAPVYLGAAGKHVNSHEVQQMINWTMKTDERLVQAYHTACETIRADCGGLSDADILDICTPEQSLIAPETLPDLLISLHSPMNSIEEGQAAQEIIKKICTLGLQCLAQRQNARPRCEQAPIGRGTDLVQKARELITEVERRRGYSLTKNQREVILGVTARFQSDQPLNGLLSGEVGAGKTVAYSVPAAIAHMAGARVAIMAPTTLLADQIAKGIASEFEGLVTVERIRPRSKINNPNAILVGTIGLNSVAKKYDWAPDYLVFDEQHKLHTAARESMVHPFTHTLDVSATPIPRSLALSLYEGMDLFTLNEQPVKRNISTALIDVNDRKYANLAIRKTLESGGRCAVVFTLVDSDQGTPSASIDAPEQKKLSKDEKAKEETARSAAIESAALFEKHFPGQVALLHGKMTDDQKAAALGEFRDGSKRLMVTTTIFETGIDVPAVEVIVVRDPQQLGLSQLHQLRGRLARSGGNGLCFLLTEDLNALSEETYHRLEVFCRTMDGYALATEDMLARGAGDLGGLQQKGKANTTFKGVKLTTHDLILNDSARIELNVKAEIESEVYADEPPRRQQQSVLFK